MRRNEFADALHDRHFALFGHACEPAGELADDFLFEAAQLGDIDLRFAECDADIGCVRRFVDHLGRVQQRLRRNAADIEANAAERRIVLDQYRVLAKIGRAERRRVAAGARTEHDDLAFDIGLAAGCACGLRRRRLGSFFPGLRRGERLG